MIDFSKTDFLSFDCYGTLIDWESGILDVLRPMLHSRSITVDDATILQSYADLETELESGPFAPYREVLARVVEGFGERFGFRPTSADREALVESLAYWRPFDDAPHALQRLSERFKLVVLSNIDDDLFEASGKRLGDPFDRVVTAAEVGSYKPSPANFRHLIRELGGDERRIVHVAQSLFHDIVPASEIGLKTVWINRHPGRTHYGATPPAEARPDLEFEDLIGLVQELTTRGILGSNMVFDP